MRLLLCAGIAVGSVAFTAAPAAAATGHALTPAARTAPANTGRPVVSGLAKVGARLAATEGKWSGAPSAFTYRWLRCPPGATLGDETGCVAIQGATHPQYLLVAADLGQRDVVEVTAENAYGQESALSAPTDLVAEGTGGEEPALDTTAPVLSKLSLSRRQFRLGASAGRGTVLRFSSTEAGTLTVTIFRTQAHKAAAAVRPFAALERTIGAGRGSVALGGRIGRKLLSPGGYRLQVTATDAAGNRSKAVYRAFRVLRG